MEPRNERDLSDPLIGRLLDNRYRVGPRIASGGMASVYEAHDDRLDRTVALKVMHPGMGDDEDFAARFVREARHAAKLSHPHVVGVYDQGRDHGTIYLAMEYVPGHTLRDVIRKEAPMAPRKALALIEPVLSALSAAHQAQLIHRDIKPENVLISDDGRVKVADFGLAKAISADTQHTATGGVLIGTVSYLAPELVVDGRADTRADVYAAGVVLYELLTGRKPHEGESPIQVAYKHVHEDVPPPSRSVPGIPAYVDALVARATARDRSHRPADARVLLHQVHRVAQALAEGVVDDPELVADLAPPSARALEEDQFREDTAQDPLEQAGPSATDTQIRPAQPVEQFPMTSHIDRDEVMAAQAGGQPPIARPADPSGVPPWNEGERDDDGDRPRRRRGPLLLVLALVAALVIGGGAYWFGVARYTTAPGVLELTAAEAKQKIEKAGLEYAEGDPEYSESVAKGAVISTDPGPGDRVLDDGTVTVVLSLGKERYDVPKVRGRSEDDAQAAIQDAHLEFGRSIPRYHPTIPAGQAISSNPKPGTSQKPGATVDIYLSQGPRPIKLLDWTGKDADKAEAWFSKRDLKVDRSEEYDDDVPEGNVISQSPSTGELFKDDTVELKVSKGPELIEVPRVVGMGQDAARDTLEDAGFKVNVEHHENYIGLGYVLSTSPGRGVMVPRGSTVTITIV
ncbi:Stk1 family PASTA domain-containing Ser/Thr kinase [Nocardioides sp. Root151]|uniref:Stk1 family PASTA domain-containing Ser/Thr kinase n=1 Tax=Nocardioides sp. Root151 TaxID=1736475 RepID=UPI0007026B20|nr:Stk1 family PASTA domain-containing Ser/Thr kinase [Nocardioides sp. Root151]KQZ69871.1 hypothetical protein ASD66_09195 [Nocardioides sp. Root151]